MRFLFVLVLYTVGFSAAAQSYLVLRKIGSTGDQIHIPIGDEIRFKLKGQDEYSRGAILDFEGDSTIRFYAGMVNINDIEAVDIREYIKNPEVKLMIAGGVFMGFDRINGAIQGGPYKFNRKVWIPAAILTGSGVLIRLIKAKKFRVGQRKVLVIKRL